MPKPNYLVIPDIHGQTSQYNQIELIIKNLLQDDPTAHIIFLGDYIDRGESGLFCYYNHRLEEEKEEYFLDIGSRMVVEKLFELDEYFKTNHFKATFLMGNHESNFIDNIKHLESFALKNKTDSSDDYKAMFNTIKGFTQDKILMNKTKEFFEQMPYYFCDEENKLFFVHAGVNPNKNIFSCDKSEYLNIRDIFFTSKQTFDYKIIFGHTPIDYIKESDRGIAGVDEKLQIINKIDRIGLDVGNYRHKYINLLRIIGDEYMLLKVDSDGVKSKEKICFLK